SVWMPPVCAFGEGPPLAEIAQADRIVGRRECQRARIDQMRQYAGIVFGIRRDFRDSDVSRRPDELPEFPIGDGMAIHPERADRDTMGGSFFRIVLVGSHPEGAAWNPVHPIDLCGTVTKG